MLDQSNAASPIVKGLDLKTPAMCDYTTGETEETKEEVHYNILKTDGNLPFYQDYFALARLLKDYDQYKTTGNRLPWDCHILSDASFAYSFYDLDRKLFGKDDIIKNLDSLNPYQLGENWANRCFDLDGAWTSNEVFATVNRMIGSFRAAATDIKDAIEKKSGPLPSDGRLMMAYNLIRKVHSQYTKDKDTGRYPTKRLSEYMRNVHLILELLEKNFPGIVKDAKGLFIYFAQVAVGDTVNLLALYRDHCFQTGLNKIKQLPCGETILYHCGLGPKPKKLNYTGLKFGDVTVEAHTTLTRYEGKRLVTRDAVKAHCVCGKVVKIATVDLLQGKVISCGNCNRPKTMPKATIARWASATVKNCRDNAPARASRRPYRFTSPEEVLYFAGIRRPGHDLGRIDDHLPAYDPPYAPGHVFWEPEAVNSAVETKSLTTSSQLNQVVMLEKLPERGIKPAEIDPFSALDDPNAPTEIDDLL